MNFKTISQCAALILASAISGAAVASSTAGYTTSVKVRFSDLDLSSTADVTTLYRRIRRASHRVCFVAGEGFTTAATQMARECRASSVDRAVAQVGLPALIEIHQKKTGRAGNAIRTADNR